MLHFLLHKWQNYCQIVIICPSVSLLCPSSYIYKKNKTRKILSLVYMGYSFLLFHTDWKKKVKVTQSCLTLCDPMDYTVHGIFQARILEWVTVPFARESSQPRDWMRVSGIAGSFFTSWPIKEAQEYWSG